MPEDPEAPAAFVVPEAVTVRNLAKREIDVRLVPWERIVETSNGLEKFERGAFADASPDEVMLMGLEHEAHIGIGQNGAPVVTRHPVGRFIHLDDREDAQYGTARVARTARGDEVLALAEEGIVSGVSVEFAAVPNGTRYEKHQGRRLAVHSRARLTGASTTYRPTFEEAAVLAVRSKETNAMPEATTVEATPAPAPAAPAVDITPLMSQLVQMSEAQTQARVASEGAIERMLERLDKLEEQGRAAFQIPAAPPVGMAHPDDFTRGDWLKLVLRMMTGETVTQSEIQARVTADLITSDNLGVVPPAYLSEMIGIIDPSRPFLQSTRRLNTPRSGMQLTVPVLTTRPTVGVQAEEKDELTSTISEIEPTNFNPTTIGGYGDISIQLLKRSDPSYLEMYLDLLAEAYSTTADDKAVDALLAASGINTGSAIDPNDGPQFGDAWVNAAAVSRRLTPDRVWMSSAAVGQFIDAKSDTTNAPLYANLAAAFTAGGGPGGSISGLQPVHVPALDDEAYDIIVGPSRGFAWAEDGTYTLQVDVPARAGKDVGIVGMIWFAPLYPAAFTRYALAGS